MSKEITPKEFISNYVKYLGNYDKGENQVKKDYLMFKKVLQALDRLELLEKENQELLIAVENKNKEIENLKKLIHDNPYKKAIEWLKDTFEITLDSKVRISDGTDCIQAFPINLKTNEVLYALLKEVLGNE